MRALNLKGVRFGRLTAVEPCRIYGCFGWVVVCDCGERRMCTTGDLRRGKYVSCGCAKRTHGLTHGGKGSREYSIWKNMRTRCHNPKFKQWKDYGGRGITIDPRWDDFAVFLADMGPCPPGLTIERSNNDLGYGPGNCVWATRAQQNRNRRKPTERNSSFDTRSTKYAT